MKWVMTIHRWESSVPIPLVVAAPVLPGPGGASDHRANQVGRIIRERFPETTEPSEGVVPNTILIKFKHRLDISEDIMVYPGPVLVWLCERPCQLLIEPGGRVLVYEFLGDSTDGCWARSLDSNGPGRATSWLDSPGSAPSADAGFRFWSNLIRAFDIEVFNRELVGSNTSPWSLSRRMIVLRRRPPRFSRRPRVADGAARQ